MNRNLTGMEEEAPIMKKLPFPLFLVYFLFIIPFSSYSQTDSLEKEILQYRESDATLISKSRQMITDNLQLENEKKIAEITNFLYSRFKGTNIIPLWDNELFLLMLYTEEYNKLLHEIQTYSTKTPDYYSDKLYPQRDLLFSNLRNVVIKNHDVLISKIENAQLKNVEKDFLAILLEFLLSDSKEEYITQDQLNQLSDKYLSEYPFSPYNNFVRNYIRFKWTTSKWGFGFDFGGGYSGFTETLNKTFTDGGNLVVGLDIQYNQFITNARINLGFGHSVRTPFEYDGYWKQNLPINVYLSELSIGYELVNNSTIKCYPFVGIASMNISPPQKEAEKPGNDVDLGFVFTTVIGANVDIKLSSGLPGGYGITDQGFMYLRLRLGFANPSYEQQISRFSGNMVYLQICFGMFGRKKIREI